MEESSPEDKPWIITVDKVVRCGACLDLVVGLQYKRQLDVEIIDCVIYHLLIYQRCRKADVWHMKCLGLAGNLDKAGIHRVCCSVKARRWREFHYDLGLAQRKEGE